MQGELSEAHLRQLLDHDRSGSGVVVSRGNKISRTHYAGRLGCHKTSMSRFNSIFAKYEEEIGVATGPLRYLSEMEEWLSREYERGRLDLHAGRLARATFCRRFKLGSEYLRYDKIRKLLERFDEQAKRDGYMPSLRRAEYKRVTRVLAGDVILNKDRRTINLVALAEAANVPRTSLRAGRFAETIAARQAEITTRVHASKVDPFVHGRVFAFSDLAPSWPMPFLERVGVRFKEIAPGQLLRLGTMSSIEVSSRIDTKPSAAWRLLSRC